MKVSWDEESKLAVVEFRSEAIEFGQYASFEKAQEAAEHYCRTLGWDGGPPRGIANAESTLLPIPLRKAPDR